MPGRVQAIAVVSFSLMPLWLIGYVDRGIGFNCLPCVDHWEPCPLESYDWVRGFIGGNVGFWVLGLMAWLSPWLVGGWNHVRRCLEAIGWQIEEGVRGKGQSEVFGRDWGDWENNEIEGKYSWRVYLAMESYKGDG